MNGRWWSKTLLVALPVLSAMLVVAQFGGSEDAPAQDEAASTNAVEGVDIDFARMNQTVLASQMYRLSANPAEFEGKTLRFAGKFLTTVGDDGKRYFACSFGTPGGCSCCSPSGIIEFEPKGARRWPEDFPPEESRITVVGRLKMVDMTVEGRRYVVPRLFDADISAR